MDLGLMDLGLTRLGLMDLERARSRWGDAARELRHAFPG